MQDQIPPQTIKKMISYFYLVSYCPPDYVADLKSAAASMRMRMSEMVHCEPEQLAGLVAPEVAKRMMAFHLSTKEPDPSGVEALSVLLRIADSGPHSANAFQSIMTVLCSTPPRAKTDNRLHRNKGCSFCKSPCRYGFFTLMSEPDFHSLQSILNAENQKPVQERDVVSALWTFTKTHLWHVLETENGFILPEHLGNLSYCLLMLGTAKSRFAMREEQLQRYQELMLEKVSALQDMPIQLS